MSELRTFLGGITDMHTTHTLIKLFELARCKHDAFLKGQLCGWVWVWVGVGMFGYVCTYFYFGLAQLGDS